MPKTHVHSLDVCLDKETNKPEIYCLDPKCTFRVSYDPDMITHWENFGTDVQNLLSKG